MPTSAEYAVTIGEDRIVSVINDAGAGVAVPATLETTFGMNPPSHPFKGNRKITILLNIALFEQGIRDEDEDIVIKVRVPVGIIKGFLQKFTGTSPVLDYIPVVRILPSGPSTYAERVYSTITAVDTAAQTLDINIINSGAGAESIPFTIEIDWSHTINN